MRAKPLRPARAAAVVFASALLLQTVAAQTPLEKRLRDDGVVYVPDSDPAMKAAMLRARLTLNDFLALAQNPKPSMSGFTVKVPIPTPKGPEYVWLLPIKPLPGKRVTGVLSNRLVDTDKYQEGQILTVQISEIVDWGYFDDGRAMGNFTTCVLLSREPEADAKAFKSSYGLNCDD